MQDGAVLLIAEGDLFQPQSGVLTGHAVAVGRLVGRQQLEDFLRRGRAIHGNVEVAAQQPQRQKEICRQQHDGQGSRQTELAFGKG